jgi:hypothetical protein
MGYVLTAVGLAVGLFQAQTALLFFAAAVVNGIMFSAACVVLEELSALRYEKTRHLTLLFVAAVIENFGFRQLTTLWRAQAWLDVFKRNKVWGSMERKGFEHSVPAPSMTLADLPATERR